MDILTIDSWGSLSLHLQLRFVIIPGSFAQDPWPVYMISMNIDKPGVINYISEVEKLEQATYLISFWQGRPGPHA